MVNHLLKTVDKLEFSVSATTRGPRPGETHGKEYYFLKEEEFKKKIENNEFLEHEQVYKGLIYGTMYSELERIWANDKTVVFDVDVVGGLNIKEKYGEKFEKAGLVCAPCTAYMYAPVEIAMRIAMEEGDVDAFECVSAGGFVPTFASMQSIYSLFNTEAQYLKNNELLPWTPGKGYDVDVPGYAVNQLVHPWAGGNLPIVFQSHPQVHTVRQYSGNTDAVIRP